MNSPARRNGNGRRQGNAFASLMWIELLHRGRQRKVGRNVFRGRQQQQRQVESLMVVYKI